MRSLPFISLIIATLIILASCDDRGDGVLSKKKMEDVLFDYHLAQAMTFGLTGEQHDRTDEYIAAVMQKHHITYEQFDTSLIYYNRHPDDLSDIYDNLRTRYSRIDEQLQYSTGNHDMRTAYTPGGDTAEVWSGPQLYILRPNPYNNLQTFSLKADTSFWPNDRLHLKANIDFVREDMNDENLYLITAITLHFTDGTTTSNVRTQSYPALTELQVNNSEMKPIERVSGYFFITSTSTTRQLAVIRNLSLMRYHTISRERATSQLPPLDAGSRATDSLNTDSLSADSATPTKPRRPHIPALNPDQKRNQNIDTLHDVKIIEQPAVRTPNSIGPRRRNVNRR